MRRFLLCGVVVLAAGVAGGLLWLWPGREAPPARAPFAGVRGRITGAVFSQTDPETGAVLVVRAGRVVTRDDRVGMVFRSPVKQVVEVRDVEVELRESEAVIASARAARGRYDPDSGKVVLERPGSLRVAGLDVETGEVSFRPDGSVELPGRYVFSRDGRNLGEGRGFRGKPTALGPGR